MADELPPMSLKAIGIIRNEIKAPPPAEPDWWKKVVSEIAIDSRLTEALDGLEEFSHIIVIFWRQLNLHENIPLPILYPNFGANFCLIFMILIISCF